MPCRQCGAEGLYLGRSNVWPLLGRVRNLHEMTDLFAVSERLAAKEQSTGFELLTATEQVFHTVWWFEAELNNGGFDQFFFNSRGNYAAQTIAALERIGASTTANIVKRACAMFPDSTPSPDWSTRQ